MNQLQYDSQANGYKTYTFDVDYEGRIVTEGDIMETKTFSEAAEELNRLVIEHCQEHDLDVIENYDRGMYSILSNDEDLKSRYADTS